MVSVNEMVTLEQNKVKGFFGTLASKINLEGWLGLVGISVGDFLTLIYFFGGSFAVGFLFKKYFRFLFSCLIVALFLLFLLESWQLVSIDWAGFKTVMSNDVAGMNIGTLINSLVELIRAHLYVCIVSVAGFMLGYRLG